MMILSKHVRKKILQAILKNELIQKVTFSLLITKPPQQTLLCNSKVKSSSFELNMFVVESPCLPREQRQSQGIDGH